MESSHYDFDAAMSAEELEAGELRHIELEKTRMKAMRLGLTSCSEELRKAYESNPEAVMKILGTSVEIVEHYKAAIELISGATARLYAIAEEVGFPADHDFDNELKRALTLISERPLDGLDN